MPDPVYYDPRQLRATAPPPVAPAPKPTLTGFQLSPSASRSFAPTSPLPPKPVQAPAGLSITGFAPQGGEQVQGSALYEAYSKLIGGVMSPAEIAVAVENGELRLDDILATVMKASGAPGFASGGGQPPVARFGFQLGADGRVFRTNDLTGEVAPTDTFIPQGFADLKVSSKGDLIGIDQSGNTKLVMSGFDFAKVDPAKTFAEQVRQFDVSEAGVNARSAADREAANQRALLGAQTAGFQTVAGLAPQLANVAQNQAQFQRDVISSPADFLFRAFSTRGQTSPLPRVTQADFINGLADEIAKYNQVLQSFNPGPVGFQQPAQQPAPQPVPQAAPTGFAAPPQAPTFVEDGGSVAPVGGISPLTRPGTPSFVTDGIPPPPANLSNPDMWAQFAAGMAQPAAAPQAAPQPAPQPVPQVAPQQTGFAVPPPTFKIPQIPVPQRATQSELRSLELQNRPPAIQSILSGEMPKPLDLGFSLPTPQQYGALTPDERRAFSTTLATQYDVTPEDYETAIRQRFAPPQTRRARVVGF